MEIEALKVVVEKFVEMNINNSYLFTIPNQTQVLTRKTLRAIAKKFAAELSKLHCTYPDDHFHCR